MTEAPANAGGGAAGGSGRPARLGPLLGRLAASMVLVFYVAGIAANAWLDRIIGPRGGDPVEDAIVFVGFGTFAVVGALLLEPCGWPWCCGHTW